MIRYVLANRYEGNELTTDAAQRVINYWGSYANETVIFTGAVEKLGFDRGIVLNSDISCVDYKSRHPEDAFFDLLSMNNVIAVNRKEICCSLTPVCTIKDANENSLMVDPDHLSIYRAELFERIAVDRLGL